MRRLGFVAVALLFLTPYLSTLAISHGEVRLPSDLLQVFLQSFLQAALSSAGALALGLVGAVGLLALPVRWELLALLPSVVPSIVLVLAFMMAAPNWRGLSAVVAAHAILSSGLVAVAIVRHIRSQMTSVLELAWIEGASRWLIWRKGILPGLRAELTGLFLTVFVVSLASFSIPLVLGGSRALTFEIAIHSAVHFEAAWDLAAGLTLFQATSLLLFTLILRTRRQQVWRAQSQVRDKLNIDRFLGSRIWIAPAALIAIAVVIALLPGPVSGWSQLTSAGLLDGHRILLFAALGSITSALLAGVLVAAILLALALLRPSPQLRVWLSAYVAPSVVLTGLTTLSIGWRHDPDFILDCIRVAVGAALLFAPALWRLQWEAKIAKLDGQCAVAESLGASDLQIAQKILLPQLWSTSCWSAGLVALWVWGDYAIGAISASRPFTLGLIARGLMNSYRLEAASLVVLGCILGGAATYWIFAQAGKVRIGSFSVKS